MFLTLESFTTATALIEQNLLQTCSFKILYTMSISLACLFLLQMLYVRVYIDVAFVTRNFGNKNSTARSGTPHRSHRPGFGHAPVRNVTIGDLRERDSREMPLIAMRQVPSRWRKTTRRSRSWRWWCAACTRWRTRCATCALPSAARRRASALPCCPSTCRCIATTLPAYTSAHQMGTSLPSTTTATHQQSELNMCNMNYYSDTFIGPRYSYSSLLIPSVQN